MVSLAGKTPKILFVNPRFPRSLWGFQGIHEIVGVRCGQAPLGLATVAGMTPREIPVELQDENVESINLDTDADVVAIGCWNVQYHRARELAREFRRRGKMVVVGGPYPTLCPERFEDGAFDIVFDGETENTWPEFCRDLLAGAPKPVYKQVGNIDMRLSPVPRFDLIRKGDYLYYFVQTTRGCPFACEFCDIIITDGRVPRLKSIPQVLKEIETVAALGGRYVSFSDANLIGNQKFAEQLLEALADFGRKNGYPIQFSAEMTITVAERPRLLELLREANFTSIFVGIESPRVDSLMETKKRQNAHRPLLDSIRLIQSHNLMIVAGMIVGFDHDDQRIFEEQFDFLMEAGIPFTTCGILTAIEKTPLHARLQKEGRLLPYDSASVMGHGAADLNFLPKLMTVEEVQRGYNWLIRSLYRYDNYSARVIQAFRPFHKRWEQKAAGHLDWELALIALKVIRHFVLTTNGLRRRNFIRALRVVMKGGWSAEKLVDAISYMIVHKHFHEYVTEVHGDPETVAPQSPFADPSLERWWEGEFGPAYLESLRREAGAGRRWLNPLAWFRPGLRRAVAIPEAFLTEKVGECLRRYLDELGVEVIPVATAALSRLRGRADLFVLPIFGSVRKGREELQQVVQQLHERVQVDLDKLPRVVHLSIDGGREAVFEAFARIGLTFTQRLERLREAFETAVDAVLVPSPQPARTSERVAS
ncbi:MAG TPA: radical SAM protein [Methylomirabilota bacterium]|jgi:radical SAM superfamily enzyme YgiQ (UPF0313 family)|nr:radical SAM protein [Methylomirabilota bacterium]